MVNNGNVSGNRGEEATCAGRMAEAEAIAEFVFESVLLKWEDVVRGKKQPSQQCCFCALCNIAGAECDSCFVVVVYGTRCGAAMHDKDPWDVLKILERDREDLVAACASFVLDHDITWQALTCVGLTRPTCL